MMCGKIVEGMKDKKKRKKGRKKRRMLQIKKGMTDGKKRER